jgi:hypothetical protein
VRPSWRKLGDWLGVWGIKLDAIERQHISDEARLKAVLEAFLLGEGFHQPSWRMLIHRLNKAGETHAADKIKTNAEPLQGEWVCTIPRCMHNTSHMTSISNPMFFPSADYAHALGPGLQYDTTAYFASHHLCVDNANQQRIDSDSIRTFLCFLWSQKLCKN